MSTKFKSKRRNFLRLNSALSTGPEDSLGIHIAGLVVHTRPENIDRVRARLERISGVEVHACDPRGKLVVTLEAPSDSAIADWLNDIPELPGVIACSLVHSHSEDGEEASA
jgi:nitrate reductase NapD